MDIALQVRRTIRIYKMMRRGDRVLVAVSGGHDSVALLYLLWELRQALGIDIHVAHLDHGLRGTSSWEDARYTRRLARRLGLPITVEQAKLSARGGRNLEEKARMARYAFLEQTASEVVAQRVATGHNADDQAETVLMRLMRGAGSEGLAGIPPVRGVFIRPLIQVRRRQIEAYLRSRRLRPHQDLTNRDFRHLRNRVRGELIPLLERSYNPNIVETLNRIGLLEREESAYFRQLTENLLRMRVKKAANGEIFLDLSNLTDYFNIGGKYLIRELIRRTKGDLRRIINEHVDRVLRLAQDGPVGSRILLPDGLIVERAARGLLFRVGLPQPFCESVKLPGYNEFSVPGLSCSGRLMEPGQVPWPPRKGNESEAFLDWARLRGPFLLRSRRRGDRFSPLGMREHRRLSDYLIDRKIPRLQRDEIPLLVGKDGVIWVVGCGIADPFKVTKRTRSILRLRCLKRGKPWSPS